MEITFTFLTLFVWTSYLVLPLLFLFLLIIIVLGQVVGRVEKWTKFDALYWSLITATTVGYGDIHPVAKLAKCLSILIAVVGMMLTGIIVSVTLYTASLTLEKYADKSTVELIKNRLQIETHENNSQAFIKNE